MGREREVHNAWGCNARETGYIGAETCCHPAASGEIAPRTTVCPAWRPPHNTLCSLPTPIHGRWRHCLCFMQWSVSFLPGTVILQYLLPVVNAQTIQPQYLGHIVHFILPVVQPQSHSAAVLLCSACSSAPCSPYQEVNKDLLPELPLAFIIQKIQTACKQHSLPCTPSAAYWIHIPLPPASLSFFNMFFLICFDEWVTTLTPDSLRLIETTQYLRRADEQLSCHLSLRLSFWLKTTHPCNRNYLELEGNLWPFSFSLLFASASILLPPPLRGILSSFAPSILPSFSLVDGNVCFTVQGFAVQGWLFVEMGENVQDWPGRHWGQ